MGSFAQFISSSVGHAVGAASVVMAAPANIKNGDVLVCAVMNYSSTPTLPTGFTSVRSGNAGASANSKYVIGIKTASTESGNYTATFSGTSWGAGILYVLRNVTVTGVASAISTNATRNATLPSPSSSGVVADSSDAVIYLYGGPNSANSGVITITAPSGLSNWTPVSESSDGLGMAMGWRIGTTAPGTCPASAALDYADILLSLPDISPVTIVKGAAVNSTTSNITGSYAHTPVAGETLIMLVGSYKGGAATVSGTTPAGWTAGPTDSDNATISLVSRSTGTMMYYKQAVGGDSAPVVALNNSANAIAEVYHVTGLDPVTPWQANTAVNKVRPGGSSSTFSPSSQTVSDNTWVFTGMVVSGTAAKTFSSGGGSTIFDDEDGTNISLGNATQSVATGAAVSPVASVTSSSAVWFAQAASMAFNIAVSSFLGSGTSLVLNPTFESDASNWITDGATLVQSTTFAHSGSGSGKITPSGIDDWPGIESNKFVVDPNSTYTGSVWFYCPSTLIQQVYVEFDWLDSSNTIISQPSTAGVTLVPGTWTKVTLVAKPPVGTVYGNIQPNLTNTPPATDIIYVDDVTVIASSPFYGWGVPI